MMTKHKTSWLTKCLFGALTLLITLCCSQSTESEKSFTSASPIAFDLTDSIDDGFEGLDFVSLTMTQGTAKDVSIIYTPKDQSTVVVAMTTTDNITFEANILFGAHHTEWFISASSSTGATTQFGASSDLKSSNKYLNKTNADQLIANIMNEKRSSSDVLTYLPNSIGNTTSIQVDDNGNLLTVELDHLVDVPIFEEEHSELHAQYAMQYNISLEADNTPSSNITDTYNLVSLDRRRDMGYIIIASTDEGGMEFILSNPSFFKDSIFLSEISGDNLQLIQY